MIKETIRAVTDWLGHPDFGVTAQIARLPLEVGDSTPDPIALIADVTRDDWIARGEEPPKFPALIVSDDGAVETDGEVETTYRDADSVQIAIRYWLTSEDSARARAQTMDTLRATVKAIRAWLDNLHEDDRTRGGIQVISANKIRYAYWGVETLGNATATGVVALDLKVRDTAP